MIWKLETNRTRLREFGGDDMGAVRALFTEPAIMRYIGGKPMSDEQVVGLLSFFRTHYEEHGFGPWAVSLRDSDAIIGVAGLKFVHDLENPDLGFSFFKPYWGKGYATEIGRALMDFGFKHRRLGKIGAIVNHENAATIRVLQKLGMSFEKTVSRLGMEWELYTATSEEREEGA